MVDRPDYIAFRVPDGDGLLVVVAVLEPGERGSFPWAKWHSESAPGGEFRKVPGGYARFGVDETVASTMIDAIGDGRSLPDQLVVCFRLWISASKAVHCAAVRFGVTGGRRIYYCRN